MPRAIHPVATGAAGHRPG